MREMITRIDPDTGKEREYKEIFKGDRYTTEAQREYYRRQQLLAEGRGPDERGEFVQFIKKNNSEEVLGKDLTPIEKHRYILLLQYSEYENKPFRFQNGVLLNAKNIEEMVWGTTKRQTIELLNKLEELGFLKREKCNATDKRETNFISTGKHFWKGKIADDSKSTKLFEKKLLEIVTELEKEIQKQQEKSENGVNRSPAPLSIIFSVLPHFHYQTYYMVEENSADHNIKLFPEESVMEALERNPDAIKHLSKAKLMNLTGIGSKTTLNKYIKMLQNVGAILEIKGNKRSQFLIHPDLMFRMDSDGRDEYTRLIRIQFNQINKKGRR